MFEDSPDWVTCPEIATIDTGGTDLAFADGPIGTSGKFLFVMLLVTTVLTPAWTGISEAQFEYRAKLTDLAFSGHEVAALLRQFLANRQCCLHSNLVAGRK